MLGIQAVPSATFFFLLFLTPDTPRWLVARRRVDEARAILARLGTDAGSVDQEIREIQTSLDPEHQGAEESLLQWKYRRPILLAVAIAMFNQLSGINALMYYAPAIVTMAGAGGGAALLQAVAVGGDEPDLHHAGDDRDRPRRMSPAHAPRLDRLYRQLEYHGLSFLFLRDQVHHDGERRGSGRPPGLHRIARVRPGSRDLGVHQ